MILEYKAQKHQGINPGGDCGPCCLAGITGLSVREIYDKYLRRIDGTSYGCIIEALWKLRFAGIVQYHHTELPIRRKRCDHEYQTFGNPSWEGFREWAEHVDSLIRQGYVGIAQVHLDGNAMGDRKHQWYTNHWVLINGIDYDKQADGNKLIVHVSCPTYGEYSKPVLEFLMNYGGYNPIWVYMPKKDE